MPNTPQSLSTLLLIVGLISTPALAVAAPQTWYFHGTVSAVEDVNGNGDDDAAFAAGDYAIGSQITGSITIDPATASPDYDDPDALNLAGPDDPQLGHYLDAVTDFELQIGSNVQSVDAFTRWSTTSSNPPIDGTVQTTDDVERSTDLFQDYYKIQLPILIDEYVWVSPTESYFIDQNGFVPITGGGDAVFASLVAQEWIWQGTSTLVQGDDMSVDLEGRIDLTTFYLRLWSSQGVEQHDIRVTYTLTYLSATPYTPPSPVPMLGIPLAVLLSSALAASGALMALRARRSRA